MLELLVLARQIHCRKGQPKVSAADSIKKDFKVTALPDYIK